MKKELSKLKYLPPTFVHLITFATRNDPENGYNGFLFQAVIRSDIDLIKGFLETKNIYDIINLNKIYISTHEKDIRKFLPDKYPNEIVERIIYYQQNRS